MAKHVYSKKHKQFIEKMAVGLYNDELTDLFNRRFGTSLSISTIKSYKSRHQIKSNVGRSRPNSQQELFTPEQKKVISENVKGRGNQELTNLINQLFDLNVTVQQMATWKQNHHLSSGLTGHFQKGHCPMNKGLKGHPISGKRATQFIKGHQPQNHRPIGSERVDREGYLWLKVAEPRTWALKHRIIWEMEKGKIPEGQVLIFADGNKSNLAITNLMLVSRRQLVYLNRNHWIAPDQKLTKIGILLADISIKANDRSE